MKSLAAYPVLLLVRFYRLVISPWAGSCCRFHPSCSAYSEQALEQHGLIKGVWLTARRVGRCHPWHPGGYDPVP